jgi:hypothetical protein
MKATHKGRLKNISDLIECLRLDPSTHIITKKYISFLNDNEGGLLAVYKEDEIWQAGEFGFSSDMFTDITPIKPKIEIPKGDFWVVCDLGRSCRVFRCASGGFRLFWTDSETGAKKDCWFEKEIVFDRINNGTWTICDEPKKEMRPLTDEEWNEWFDDGGLCLSNPTIRQRAQKISVSDNNEFIFFHRWFSKEYFVSNFTDKNGNKFEKEI